MVGQQFSWLPVVGDIVNEGLEVACAFSGPPMKWHDGQQEAEVLRKHDQGAVSCLIPRDDRGLEGCQDRRLKGIERQIVLQPDRKLDGCHAHSRHAGQHEKGLVVLDRECD